MAIRAVLGEHFGEQPDGDLDPEHWITASVRQGIIAEPLRNAGPRPNRWTTNTLTRSVQGGMVTADASAASAYATAPSVATSTPWTILSYGVLRSSGSACAVGTMAEAPGNATRDRSLIITSADVVEAYLYNGTAPISVLSTKTVRAGKPVLLAATTDGVNLAAFCDGEYTAGSVGSSPPTPYGFTAYSSPEFVIGYGGGSNTYGGGTVTSVWSSVYCLLLNSALSASRLYELQADPMAPFRTRRIIVPVTAAAPSSFLASWARRPARTIGAGVI